MKGVTCLLALPLALALSGCQRETRQDRAIQATQEARAETREAMEETREAQEKTQQAIQETHGARAEHVQNLQRELSDLDKKIANLEQQKNRLDQQIQAYHRNRAAVVEQMALYQGASGEALSDAKANLDAAMNRLRQAYQVAARERRVY
jgi:seryl-tRNA synthetase